MARSLTLDEDSEWARLPLPMGQEKHSIGSNILANFR